MARGASEITFIVPGQLQPAGPIAGTGAKRGTVKSSVRVGAVRDGGKPLRIVARPGEDVVVLKIANGPTLVLHPENARALLQAQAAGTARGTAGGGGTNEVMVSPQLGWPGLESAATRGATRGWLGQAMLGGVDVITDLVKDPAADFVATAIIRKIDGAVDEGVYQLDPAKPPEALKRNSKRLTAVPASANGGPLLVFVHGTFVDTGSTFGKLWGLHPETVRNLFAHYGNRVYALDHATVGASPIANALTLVRAMPAGATLHLVTHSRGGLVAEVLARACGGRALSDGDRDLFAADEYKQHRADLEALVAMARRKGLKLERVVRVACPARGTLLASKRLDAYLSVLQWGLELAGVPVLPELVDFLHEVARRRADPSEAPGLEAMMPESAVVKWLNAGDAQIPGELRVIAGDLEGDSVGSWVKTLLADAFFWTDNDLVVQTRSMYGGTPRSAGSAAPGASFVLDRGAKVTHFNYFANESTVAAMVEGLTRTTPDKFAAIGPLSWAGESASGTRAAKAVARSRGAAGTSRADRPAVFVLPGILGSNLKYDGTRIWLSFRFVNGLAKLAWDPKTASHVEPDGPIAMSYDDLIERLADTHEVIPFAYDWRRPIEDEARRLAAAIDAELAVRATSQKPVRILAHSMGGLVARTVQLEKPETWRRMMARDGARLLMLGTPNAGSWAPMQTLSGDDTFGNTLVAFGSPFDTAGARKLMAGMPGFIQLQASLLDPAHGLDKESAWTELAEKDMAALRQRSSWHNVALQLGVYEWGAPPQAVLDQAVKLRRRLDAQRETLGADAAKILLVLGHSEFTPDGYAIGPNGLEYLNASDEGDGRVTSESARLPGVATWKVNAEHGKLADEPSAFAAYVDLLTDGKTSRLEPCEPMARSQRSAGRAAAGEKAPTARIANRPSRSFRPWRPPSSEADVLGVATESRSRRVTPGALSVSVLNANLKFIHQPLLIGHYRSMKLSGAEYAIDKLIGQRMSRALRAGLYPDAVGSHQVFKNIGQSRDNPFAQAIPCAAIVVGLGEEGKLRTADLTFTVRQAVLAYAQHLSEREDGAPAQFEMAATLMASGGPGFSPGSAARAIAQGALDANIKLEDGNWPRLGHLTLVELYLDRAGEAWRALRLQETATPERLKLIGKVERGEGSKRSTPDSSYRGAAYDFLSALPANGDPVNPKIAYTLDTKRARTEVRGQITQGNLLRSLVTNASNDANTDPAIGHTLFNLLVPVEIEPFLGGATEMVIELNPSTAGIPWELLNTDRDARTDDKRPWAIRSKLIRKLQLEDFRGQPKDASAEDDVLVIGEPACDPQFYPRLEGARSEAKAVAARLSEGGIGPDKVHALIDQNDAQTIINALFEHPYRIIHVAGHGAPGRDGGVVLSGPATYLGANEVRAMRTVPELVFLNCCHLAGRDAQMTLQPYNRSEFAANIAEALIRIGVRCVVAAGWAVEDGPAEQFATAFYEALVRGERFMDAVGHAREAAWVANPRGNTWAAYQCYGDPEWTWRREGADAQRPPQNVAGEFDGIASPESLALALESLKIDLEDSTIAETRARLLDKLNYLEGEFKALWGGMGMVAEAFGAAYAGAKDSDKAIEWYQRAVDSEDGRASFKAAEQLVNHQVRRATTVAQIEAGIAELEHLVAVQSTQERQSLLGSAYKRLTMMEWKARRRRNARIALAAMVKHYAAAEALAKRSGASNLFYPAKNRISAEIRAAFVRKRLPVLDTVRVKAARESMVKAAASRPEFWSVVGQCELVMLEALAAGRLATVQAAVIKELQEHKARAPAAWLWASVYDEAKFTMEPYLGFAKPAEKHAAESLLELLQSMAA